jgi:hypothetical protein
VWSTIFNLLTVLLVAWFVGQFVASVFRPLEPAEPDDNVNAPARLRPRPHSNAGAVALAEPYEDDDDHDAELLPRK